MAAPSTPAGGELPAPPTTRWLDEREQAVWRGYLTMGSALLAHLNRNLLTASGLSEGDYAVLVSLSEADGERLRAFELARGIQWEKSRLSHQLTRMERRGLVRREECLSDARGAFVALTDAGRQAIEVAAPRHVEDVRRWFIDLLSAEQLDALEGIIATVMGELEPECTLVMESSEEPASPVR
jgi:DNA-binding MarR family transcriptional regulator